MHFILFVHFSLLRTRQNRYVAANLRQGHTSSGVRDVSSGWRNSSI